MRFPVKGLWLKVRADLARINVVGAACAFVVMMVIAVIVGAGLVSAVKVSAVVMGAVVLLSGLGVRRTACLCFDGCAEAGHRHPKRLDSVDA